VLLEQKTNNDSCQLWTQLNVFALIKNTRHSS